MIRRLLFFLLAFSLEVRVHAGQKLTLPTSREVTQMPLGCVSQDQVCAVMVPREKKWIWRVGPNQNLILGPESVVVKLAQRKVRLIQGILWVQGEGQVETEFGSLEGHDFWAVRDEKSERIWIRAPSAAVVLRPRGGPSLELPAGSETYFGRANSKGQTEVGFPQPLRLNLYFEMWARLYSGADFKGSAERVKQARTRVVELLSTTQSQLAERTLASVHEADRRARQRLCQSALEQAQTRALFRQKNHLDL